MFLTSNRVWGRERQASGVRLRLGGREILGYSRVAQAHAAFSVLAL